MALRLTISTTLLLLLAAVPRHPSVGSAVSIRLNQQHCDRQCQQYLQRRNELVMRDLSRRFDANQTLSDKEKKGYSQALLKFTPQNFCIDSIAFLTASGVWFVCVCVCVCVCVVASASTIECKVKLLSVPSLLEDNVLKLINFSRVFVLVRLVVLLTVILRCHLLLIFEMQSLK